MPSTTCPACARKGVRAAGARQEPRRRPVRRLYRFAANNKSKHKPYEAPSPSELDDDEYATSPPNLGFFSTGGGASANRRFSTTGI